MIRYDPTRYQHAAAPATRHNRLDGYQFSLLSPPAPKAAPRGFDPREQYTVRAVAPALRSLVARTGNRCPECAGPLVNGEGCVACPVCGFSRRGW